MLVLHLVELGREDGRQRILLPVHDALLERGVDLGERHRLGRCAERREGLDEQRVLDHAQLQAGEVLGRVDRPAAVGDLTEAVLPEAQPDQPLLRQLGHQLLAERAVQQRIGLLALVEQERQVDQAERLQPGAADQGRGVGHGHLERAALQRRDHGHVVAERAAGEQLDLDLAAALLLHQLAELLHRLGLRVIVVQADPDLDRALADVLRAWRPCPPAGRSARSRRVAASRHAFLPRSRVLVRRGPPLSTLPAGRVTAGAVRLPPNDPMVRRLTR